MTDPLLEWHKSHETTEFRAGLPWLLCLMASSILDPRIIWATIITLSAYILGRGIFKHNRAIYDRGHMTSEFKAWAIGVVYLLAMFLGHKATLLTFSFAGTVLVASLTLSRSITKGKGAATKTTILPR